MGGRRDTERQAEQIKEHCPCFPTVTARHRRRWHEDATSQKSTLCLCFIIQVKQKMTQSRITHAWWDLLGQSAHLDTWEKQDALPKQGEPGEGSARLWTMDNLHCKCIPRYRFQQHCRSTLIKLTLYCHLAFPLKLAQQLLCEFTLSCSPRRWGVKGLKSVMAAWKLK